MLNTRLGFFKLEHEKMLFFQIHMYMYLTPNFINNRPLVI